MLCTLTLVCALVSAHTYNLFAYRYSQVLVYIHRIMDSFVYEPTLCEHTYMFVPLRLLTVRSSLYTYKIYIYTHKYTNFILQILLCMTPCCANSHMSVPLRVLTVRTSLHTYICHKYTYIPSQIRWYINLCCALSHLFVPLWVLTLTTCLHTDIHKY